MSHSGQKHVIAQNTTNLIAKLYAPAKIHFITHSNPAKSHQAGLIGLNKPKYYAKEFQEVKIV